MYAFRERRNMRASSPDLRNVAISTQESLPLVYEGFKPWFFWGCWWLSGQNLGFRVPVLDIISTAWENVSFTSNFWCDLEVSLAVPKWLSSITSVVTVLAYHIVYAFVFRKMLTINSQCNPVYGIHSSKSAVVPYRLTYTSFGIMKWYQRYAFAINTITPW